MMKRFTNQSNGSQAGRMYNGGAKFCRFALFPLMLLMLLLLPAGMVAQKAASSSKYIATYESSTQTLTFKKNVGETLPENSAWVEDRQQVATINKNLGNGTIVHIVFDKSFSTYTPTSLYKFFANLTKLKTITGLEYLNTEKVTNMSYMFFNCSSLTSLDVTHFNTAKVTNMNRLFAYCSSLTSLDVTHFNTAKVTNMNSMFECCSSLTSLDVTYFNTANVTGMNNMFYSCSALTTIYASDNFVTDKVEYSYNMFYDCTSLKGTTLEYVASKTDHNYANCGTDGYFTPGCGYAEFDNATGTLTFRYKGVKPEGAYDLNVGITDPGWRTHKNEIKKVVFDASFANARPTSCYYWFYECKNLANIEGIENLNTEKVTNMELMFANCSTLTSLDVTKFNTANVTTLMSMFSDCSSLKSLDVTNFDTRNVTNMFYMFNNCSGLTSLDVTKFNTAKVRNMYSMFMNCSGLKSLDVTNFDTGNVISMAYMFYECSALTSLDLTNFNTAKVMDMCFMFKKCSGLTSLNLTKFNTAEVTDMSQMFNECSALTTIYASDEFVTTNVETGSNMFFNCIKLKGFIEYNKNTDKENYKYANYKTGYFTKLVGKNGDEKIGATGETLATDNLALDDDKDFVAYEPFAAKAASYSRTMNAGTTWATLCLPFEVSLDGQNFRAFKLLSADDVTETVELEEIEGSIEAGTPVIIKMNDGATELKFTEADKEIAKDVQTAETADANYKLQGIYTKKEFSKDTDNNCYIVKGDKLMNPAKLLDKTTTEHVGSKPFRAYMVDNSSAPAAGARMFSISVGGSTTAIEQLETTADSKAEYYDLQGRRLQNLQKGVNIVKRGGKTMKVIIK
ncbi:BspA family leucine-rich repeat surface protein [Segatella copri]|uniref:BspA family leucine-rich repeat surface protein n=1 Tax=Segatella copri TaxID=165179 RepID=UPI00222E0FD1|nr:BspA family leucine-rich repeat surface protein [Segatella copri]MCW4081545.1 BspA family leucine-rich repeat surface protein [Segatella copri]